MNEIKETNKLKPVVIHDQGICVYDLHIDVGVDPYELIEICKNEVDVVLPEDWTLTQDMVQKMMDKIQDEGDFYEGDFYDVEGELNKIHNGDDSETEYTNQDYLYRTKLRWTIMDVVRVGDKTKFTPKLEYGGVGKHLVTDQYETTYQNEISELESQIKDLEGKINELNKEKN